MRVALIVIQLKVTANATESGLKLGAARAFSSASRIMDWPDGCSFYFTDSMHQNHSKVKRVRIVDLPEDRR